MVATKHHPKRSKFSASSDENAPDSPRIEGRGLIFAKKKKKTSKKSTTHIQTTLANFRQIINKNKIQLITSQFLPRPAALWCSFDHFYIGSISWSFPPTTPTPVSRLVSWCESPGSNFSHLVFPTLMGRRKFALNFARCGALFDCTLGKGKICWPGPLFFLGGGEGELIDLAVVFRVRSGGETNRNSVSSGEKIWGKTVRILIIICSPLVRSSGMEHQSVISLVLGSW